MSTPIDDRRTFEVDKPLGLRQLIELEDSSILRQVDEYGLSKLGVAKHINRERNQREMTEFRSQLVSMLKENAHRLKTPDDENELRALLGDVVAKSGVNIPQEAIEDYIREIHHYGIIDPLMQDEEVTDIKFLGPIITYKKNNVYYRFDQQFASNEAMMAFVQAKLDRTPFHYERAEGTSDGRLPDGSRILVKGENTALQVYNRDKGRFDQEPCNLVAIRKFVRDWSLDELIESGMMDGQMKDYFQTMFDLNYSALITGERGVGKTSLINALCSLFDPLHHVAVIEDSPELTPHHPWVIRMWDKKANGENKGAISMESNIRDTARLDTKYVIIGETRVPDVALEYIKAIDFGSLCITSTHANDPQGGVMRMIFLAIASKAKPSEQLVRVQLRRMRLLIHSERLKATQGRPKLTRISELLGFEDNGTPIIHDVFRYNFRQDRFDFLGISKQTSEEAQERNIQLPDWMVGSR